MGAKTLPLDCRRKERNQRFLYVFLERIREKEGENLPRKSSKKIFSSSRRLGGIYGKNLTLQLLVAP